MGYRNPNTLYTHTIQASIILRSFEAYLQITQHAIYHWSNRDRSSPATFDGAPTRPPWNPRTANCTRDPCYRAWITSAFRFSWEKCLRMIRSGTLMSSVWRNSPANGKENDLKKNEGRAKVMFNAFTAFAVSFRPLVWLGMTIMTRFEVPRTLNCDEATLQNWLTVIEANYHSTNTYHNSTHAADVLQSTAYFLQRNRIKALLDPLDLTACLIAAAIHDVDHPGKTRYLICPPYNLAKIAMS